MDINYHRNQSMDSEQVHHLLTIEDPSFVREIQLDAATYSIGRHSSNDIVLSCQKTSRNHATLLRRTDVKTNQCSYWVLDGDLQGNRSRNGIYVNGKKSLVHELQSGDVVQFSGDASIRYRSTSAMQNTAQLESASSSPTSALSKPIVRDTFVNKETVVTPEQKSFNNYRSPKALDDSPSPASSSASLAESSPQPIIEIDLYGNISYINSVGVINFKELYQQKLKHPLLENLIAQYHQGHDRVVEREVTVGDKTFRQLAYYLPDRKVIRNYLTDITQQKALENELRQTKHLYDTVTGQIAEGIIIVGSATKQIIEVNFTCSQLLGYSNAELLQMNIYELVSESEKFAPALRTVIADQKGLEGEYLLRHKENYKLKTTIRLDSIGFGSTEKICLIIRDSEPNASIKTQQRSANFYRKELFHQQLLTAIANAKRSQKLLAVMLCQINFLPDLQATLGTEQSDKLLLALEKRLSSCLREGDSIVRWQEDRFALLMPQVSDVEEITKIGQRINQATDYSFTLGETQATIKSTMGIAVYPQDGNDLELLLTSAATALERAKHQGNSYQFYDNAMNSQALVALELEGLLQQALDREEFQLYYQPQIDVRNGKIEAVAALLRWYHPELGLVAPGNFIKLAEKTNLIVPIGEWAIYAACKQHQEWQGQLPSSKIIVSLSSIQFQQPNLPQKIAEILSETELDVSLLELEISAATLIENSDRSKHTLDRLKALGVSIAVDGFATGFSALEYLKQFTLDTLKIDRSLVQQLTNSPQDLAIVSALIELGKGFNLRLVAEGVETQEQVELLRSLNCHYMQGFWFGRPLAAEEAKKLLQLDNSEEATMTKSETTEIVTVDENRELDLDNSNGDRQQLDSQTNNS